MINVFRKTSTNGIKTWIVKWNKPTICTSSIVYQETVSFFTSRESAMEFAQSLKQQLQILDCNSGPLSTVICEHVAQ